MSFHVALANVILTLVYIIPGFLICKMKKACADHLSTLSAVLVYICAPCMMVNSFLSIEYSSEGMVKMAIFFVATLLLQSTFMLAIFFLFRKKYADSKYRILTIGSVLGNVGFFGLPVVRALLPDFPEVMCYSSIYVLSMNMLVFTMGVFCLTNKREYVSVKAALLNPTTLGFVVALPLYVFGVGKYLPPIVTESVALVGGMTTPLCMFILGIRLATVSFKKLFMRPVVYAVCACKLLVFPLFCYAAVYFLPLDYAFKASMLVLSAAPCASVIFNMAEMHHSETELSANCVLLTTLLCFLTIPLLTLLL